MYTEPERNVFNHTNFESLLQFAYQNSQVVRGHNLVCHQEIADWVLGGDYSNKQIYGILINYIENLADHFAGRLIQRDLVNEALNDGDSNFRETFWYNATNGLEYIYDDFKAACKADPYAKLFYNDYQLNILVLKLLLLTILLSI